jgi:hypothetical protein
MLVGIGPTIVLFPRFPNPILVSSVKRHCLNLGETNVEIFASDSLCVMRSFIVGL